MILRALNYRQCKEHGHCLHNDLTCVHCVKPVAVTRPEPSYARKPVRTNGRFGQPGRPRSYDLTQREREIANLLAAGVTQADVARQLGIARNSIPSTLRRSMDRIGATNTGELLRYVRGQS